MSNFSYLIDIDGIWECPDLFELKCDNFNTKWVLTLSVISGSVAGGSGMIYFIGDFDGKTFCESSKNEPTPNWIDNGADFYAAVSFSNIPMNDGRRIWLGWMNNWDYADNVPTSPWRGMLSIPRELSLKLINENIKLIQKPITELKELRQTEFSFTKLSVAELNEKLSVEGNFRPPFELMVELEAINSTDFSLIMNNEMGEEISFSYRRDNSRVILNRAKFGETKFSDKFHEIHSAPIKLKERKLFINIFVDTSSFEIFCNNGEVVFSDLILTNGEISFVEFYSDSSSLQINSLTIWNLKNI